VVIRRTARDYRRFALEHPSLSQAMLPAPKPGEDEELYAAMASPVNVLADSLTEAGVDEVNTVHLISALRAVVHGFGGRRNSAAPRGPRCRRGREIALAAVSAARQP